MVALIAFLESNLLQVTGHTELRPSTELLSGSYRRKRSQGKSRGAVNRAVIYSGA